MHRGPGVAQELGVGAAAENVVAIDHQYKLGVQVFPVVGVLPAELIDFEKRIFFGCAEVVGNGSFAFAGTKCGLMVLLCLPSPDKFFGLIAQDGLGEGAHLLLVQVGPELYQRHGTVEADVERGIVGIVVALHKREHGRRFGIGPDGAPPE